jgi:hypothetical protein
VGKTEDQQRADVRRDIAATINRMVEVANLAVADLTDEDVKMGFNAPKRDAPAWTDLVTRIVSGAARTENPTTVNNNLQLVMVGRAASLEDWKAQAKQVEEDKRKRIAAIIDVPEPAK